MSWRREQASGAPVHLRIVIQLMGCVWEAVEAANFAVWWGYRHISVEVIIAAHPYEC